MPVKSRSREAWNADGSEGYDAGSRGSAPAITLSRNATSATDLAIGPFTETPTNGICAGAIGTRPTVGRRATMLLKLAGLRSEPPRSPPSANGSSPAAIAAPAPPLEPPALFERSIKAGEVHGFKCTEAPLVQVDIHLNSTFVQENL